MVIGMIVQFTLKSKFNAYSKIPTSSGLSGKEVAEKMLRDNGIYDVQITSVEGMLSDHYDPLKKTVNLSSDVFEGRNISAAAVAAHECGHAVQHATAYSMLEFRSAMVPVQNVTASILNFIFMAMMFGGFLAGSILPWNTAILVVIGCYAVFALFSIVTLPVEFDASRRALAWVRERGIVSTSEYDMAQDALKWAAMTYVVAAIGAITMLIYYVMMFLDRR